MARRILMLPIRLFSSIWLGISLLASLFIYSSIGSAGVPKHINIFDPGAWVALRQWRPFEMTEFEWFHWWPFTLLIGLICLNIIVATLRRIPFNVVNVGVWMIHGGILILCAGSMWYFGVKVEGDAPVNRRLLTIHAPGSEPTSLPVIPGNRIVLGRGHDQYALTITSIDPQWEILSGDDVGKRVYSVNVEVQSATGIFIRQLLAGYPQYTEDVIRNPNPAEGQPMVRAITALGKPLMDEALQLSLEYDPQQWFYLMDSRAVYLRELKPDGTPKSDWVQRPIKELPRYNDYIASADDAWLATGQEPLDPDPISVQVPPVDANDPLPNTTLQVSRFLRYAQLETRRRIAADGPFDPVARVRITSPQGRSESYDLAVADPQKRTASNGKIAFVWINSPEQLDALKKITEPMLRFTVPGTSVAVEAPVRLVAAQNPDLPFTPIAGTEYSYRVQGVQDGLNINNRLLSVAIVEFKTPQKSFTRWVFDDFKFNRDLAQATGMAQHEAGLPLDAGIETTYRPGHLPPAPVMIVGGPGENDLTAVISLTTEQKVHPNIKAGDVIPIAEGITLDVQQYAARTVEETKPSIIPREQRDRDAREFYSMIRVDVPADGATLGEWLPYNLYAFHGPEDVLRRFPYRQVFMTMPDGRRIEMMFARQRMALPVPVALDDFRVASHIGGFTGQTSSVMDWTSMISFRAPNGEGWTTPVQVSVNKPAEHMGMWYFQAQWDPPEPPRAQGDPGSRGLNYTVLGVGNRQGVLVQLAGCCIAVLGMIFTFYVRPFVKRHRQQRVYSDVATSGSMLAGRRTMDAMVAVLEEDHP